MLSKIVILVGATGAGLFLAGCRSNACTTITMDAKADQARCFSCWRNKIKN